MHFSLRRKNNGILSPFLIYYCGFGERTVNLFPHCLRPNERSEHGIKVGKSRQQKAGWSLQNGTSNPEICIKLISGLSAS